MHNMSACDVAWHSKREKIRRFTGAWCGAVKFEREPTIHIHQKPVGLYRWLLKHFATPGELILDTHFGSGSIAIACHDYGYNLTACEIDETYYLASLERLASYVKQQSLFTPTQLTIA